MRPGGVYDGARRLKDEGIVDHICCSLHAPIPEMIKIIESGAFEGITISYSLLNAASMQPVLDCALEHDVGVTVMNPLGGGLIPQNPGLFSCAYGPGENNIVTSALKFVKAHPAVNIVLSGMKDEVELYENLNAITAASSETDEQRLARVLKDIQVIKDFCTGCNYCQGCPAGIPISTLMQQRNRILFDCKSMYNRTNPELVENLNLFYRMDSSLFKTSDNPCIRCGACEKKCTQKLPIMERVADTYERAKKTRYSATDRKDRVKELLYNKGYRRVGLYPNGGFANLVREIYEESFGEPGFEWLQFNSNPKVWGQPSSGLIVHSPDEIESLHPDIIIICTYQYDKEIYEKISPFQAAGIKIEKLHGTNDVPWVW